MSFLAEFAEFILARRKFWLVLMLCLMVLCAAILLLSNKYWLIALLAMVVLFCGLVLLTAGSAVASYIYTLF